MIQDSLGLSPSRVQLCRVAETMLRTSGHEISLGKTWIRNFLQRNPSIKDLKGKKVATERYDGASPDRIKKFIESLAEPLI